MVSRKINNGWIIRTKPEARKIIMHRECKEDYTYTYIHTYIYTYTYTHTHTYIYIYTNTHIHI